MANYCCTVRTNYFHVNDEEGFLSFMKRVYGYEDSVDVWTEDDGNGGHKFGFGCYGGIGGLRSEMFNDDDDDENDEDTYDDFIFGLQQYVADDDAILIFEAGNEKLRYVIGSVTIITKTKYEYRDIMQIGSEIGRQLLGNPNWKTQCDY